MSEAPQLNEVSHRATAFLNTTDNNVSRDEEGRRVYWALAYDSTSTDLHGTRMTADAFKGSAENLDFPVLLFHEKASFPVAKPVATKYENRGLHVGFVFASTPQARIAEELVSGGFLRGVSVGFVPRDGYLDKTDGATVFTRAELIELSLTPTPSSRKALVDLSRSIGQDPDELAEMFELIAEETEEVIEFAVGTTDEDRRAGAIDTLRSLGVDESIISLLSPETETATEVDTLSADETITAATDVEAADETTTSNQAATLSDVRGRNLRNLALTRRHTR